MWSHFGLAPTHLNPELAFHLQIARLLVLQGVHKCTPCPATRFLTICRCSLAEQTEGCLKEHFCLECTLPGQVHFYTKSLSRKYEGSRSLEGEETFCKGPGVPQVLLQIRKERGTRVPQQRQLWVNCDKTNKRRGKPQPCFHSHSGERVILQPSPVQAAPRQEKGPLAQVIGAAGPNRALVCERHSSLWSLICLIGSSSHRPQL